VILNIQFVKKNTSSI